MKQLLTLALGIAFSSTLFMTPARANNQSEYQLTSTGTESLLNTAIPETSFEGFKQSASSPHGTTVFGLPINEGPIDRTIRGVVAAGLIGTAIYGLTTKQISEPISYTLLGVSAIPTLTAATGFCPIYPLLGIDYTF